MRGKSRYVTVKEGEMEEKGGGRDRKEKGGIPRNCKLCTSATSEVIFNHLINERR